MNQVPSILIDPGIFEGTRRSGEIESLAAAIRDAVTDHPVQVKYDEIAPWQPSSLDDIQFAGAGLLKDAIEAVQAVSLSIHVPWEALVGAVATVFIESVRDWLGGRYKSRYAERQDFAAQATTEAMRQYRNSTPIEPHQVEIFGPRGELIGLVYQDADLSQPKVLVGPAAVDHVRHQRRRSWGWS